MTGIGEGNELLAPLRKQIDALDDQLVALLAQRFALVADVARLKAPAGIAPLTPNRFQAVLARVSARAEACGLDPLVVRRIYDTMHDEACRLEAGIIGESK